MAATHVLSKSSFVRGLQCEKALWLYRNRIDLMDAVGPAQQAIFDRGTDVGLLAQQLFPGGRDLSPEYVNGLPRFAGAIDRTQDAIAAGESILYEAAFVHQRVLAAVDILVREDSVWRAYEVKSGTSAKDTYRLDAAVQHWVLTGAGIELADISIVHIDRAYVRTGAIEVDKLFSVASVGEHARARSEAMAAAVARLKNTLAQGSEPVIPIGPHCDDPYECPFKGYCWATVPPQSIFDVSRLGATAWALFARGITRAAEIPADQPLKRNQRIEVECARTGEAHIDVAAVRSFVATVSGPLYFLDFETCAPAVPLFDNTSPYQAVASQYSLHYRSAPGNVLTHCAFLGDGRTDPRRVLAESLVADAAAPGKIIVYSLYERRILDELARAYPDLRDALRDLIARLVDLSVPFRDHAYYTAAMNGSYSIKAVLPALVPELSYTGLAIADGSTASAAYEALHRETDAEKVAQVRASLLKYCELDTLAMVKLLEVLEQV